MEQRELVIHHFKKGQSVRKIAEIVNLSGSTVQHIIERLAHKNLLDNKGKNRRKIKVNPKLSVLKLAS